jgi:hypothetical protein
LWIHFIIIISFLQFSVFPYIKSLSDSTQFVNEFSPSQNQQNGGRSRQNSHSAEKFGGSPSSSSQMRPNSLAQLAQNAQISPDAPIILFMGIKREILA